MKSILTSLLFLACVSVLPCMAYADKATNTVPATSATSALSVAQVAIETDMEATAAPAPSTPGPALTSVECGTDMEATAAPAVAQVAFAGGKGTQTDPYRVATAAQLNEIRQFPNAWFIQTANIDLGVAPWNSGNGWSPVGPSPAAPFTGSFNGNGFNIANLTINTPDSSYTGLFGSTAGASLSKITLVNAIVKGKDFVGALAGQITAGSVEQVVVSGSVTAKGEFAGGIAGMIAVATVTESRSSAAVTGHRMVGGLAGSGMASGCEASGRVTGVAAAGEESSAIGGLLGQGYAVNSHASGEVTGGSETGGLIGTGSAEGCHASGNVTATGDYVGGLIGDMVPFGSSTSDAPEYSVGVALPPDTIKKSKEVTSVNNAPTVIVIEDGTRAVIPAFPAPLIITLEKSGFDFNPEEHFAPGSDLRTSGSMRKLVIKGSGDAGIIKPIITIPAGDGGTINAETINVMRIGSMFVNGEKVDEFTAILPVQVDASGNYKFIDPLFPDGVFPDSLKSASLKGADLTSAGGGNLSARVITGGSAGSHTAFGSGNEGHSAEPARQIAEMAWVGEVRYYLISFDKSLNWSKRPELVRMVPDSTITEDGFRKPWNRVSPKLRKKIESTPICNVVILVHGHNEEEKGGYVGHKIITPWEFSYKRLVWNILYEEVCRNQNKNLPSDCTAFYEFISPTYRPIFSPVGEKTGYQQKTLGEDLGRLINEEMDNNPQLKAMLEVDMPFNLFVIAHSQGGLVARAGLRFVDQKILKNLKKVITWGSPHTGAGLYTLRYALAVGHDMIIDDVKFPLQNMGQSEAYQSAIAALALDAPGIRDLRWDASKKDMLRLGELFRENTATLNEFPETELPGGKAFFSDNLKLFNESEGSWTGGNLQGKYKFYEGETMKDAPIELGFDWWKLKRLYYFGKNATEIEKGAQLNKLVMKAAYNPSDGAVPTYSQRAGSVWPAGDIQNRQVGNFDHEQFYGGEPPHRDSYSISKGKEITGYTLTDMEMTSETRSCPKLELTNKEEKDSLYITGQLLFPLYAASNGNDGKPGNRLVAINALRDNQDGAEIPALVFKFKDDGSFEGKGLIADIPDDTIVVVATFKDNSRVMENLERKLANMVRNVTKKIWYTSIQKAVTEADSGNYILVYPGTYKEGVAIQKMLTIQSKGGADVTILEGTGYGFGFTIYNNNSVIEGFTIKKFSRGIHIWDTGINPEGSFPILRYNKIIECDETGISVKGKTGPKIIGNVIVDNRYYGIDFDKYFIARASEPPLIEGNYISGHNRGIRIDGQVTVMIRGNKFIANESAVEVLHEAVIRMENDTLDGNGLAVRLYNQTDSSIIGNCLFLKNDIGVSGETDNGRYQIHGNIFNGNRIGIQFDHYSVGNPVVDITQNQVLNGEMGIKVMGCTFTIKGNTISGNKGGGGVSISGASGEASANTISENTASIGAGISVSTTGDVLIKGNTITRNQATDYGGGIYSSVSSYEKRARIEGNTISQNYAAKQGGGIYGRGFGWAATEVVTVLGKPETVPRYVPCFTETSNEYSGNTNGIKLGAWGPGIDKWCDDSAYDVYF